MSVNSTSSALTGLSGYDFSTIVTQMVQVYKLPENHMVDKQTKLQTQQNAWKDVNTRLSALDTTITALKASATWSATSATSSDTSYVTSTGGSGALPGSYAVSVTQIAYAETVVSKETTDAAVAASMPAYAVGSWDFSINGKNIAVSTTGTTPTLTEICNSINSTSGVGVSASLIKVDATNYRISITGKNTGSTNAITFADPGATGIFGAMGLTIDGLGHAAALTAGNGGRSQQAQDASFKINSVDVTSATNTVTTAIQGVTLGLIAAGNSTVTVATDTSVAQKAVQSFVDQYNSVQSFIATKLKYDPTTKEAGDLFGDAALQGIQSRLRGMVGGYINNPTSPYTNLSSVGIKTSSKDATLTLDTAKFTDALSANPQSVANLFSAPYNGVTPLNDSVTKTYEGLGNTLHAYLYPAIMSGGSFAQTQSNFDNQLRDVAEEISKLDDRATQYEATLKLKFARLETLLSSLNSQSSSLTNMISSMASTSKK